MTDIIPSTKLKMISVHKIWSLTCWRKYFWSRVLNLEPKKLNLNFWFGGCLHVGFQTWLLTGNMKKVKKAVLAESRRRTIRYSLTSMDEDEIRIQLELLFAILEVAAKQKWVKDIDLEWAERQFKTKLKKSGLLFCCSVDGGGKYKAKPTLMEIKTASQVSNNYFTSLAFDKQVNGYPMAAKKSGKLYQQCCFCVFRKIQKRVKKGQTIEGFIKEIKKDLAERADWYFILYKHRLGRSSIRQAWQDIESAAEILKMRYDMLTNVDGYHEVLNPDNWPRNERQCLNYGACPYLVLCRYPKKYKLYMRLYQMRQFLYKEEESELQI